jgi:SSS family transporter
MNALDWTIIIAYMLGMIGLSAYLKRGQVDDEDYYVGGRNLPWWAVGISTMATQTSAISFISIPAFVALKTNGGLTWLQYELALPLAIIFTMVFLLPFFRKLELVSVYEYLELRFGPTARMVVSGMFLLGRGLGSGIGVYASGIVLSVCLGIPVWATVMLIGAVTVIYDTMGGMKAVVYSDVIQMFVLIGGLLLCIGYVAAELGGLGVVFSSLPAQRWEALDLGTGIGDGAEMPFWAFLIGGFFLYTSYYGVDQSQVQRELSAPTIADTKRALLLNGLARFPLTLLYLCLGIAAFAMYTHSAELRAAVPADRLDELVPRLILLKIPQGMRAVLFAAILSAAMSSLDSSLNSLSAATMRDFIEKYYKPSPQRQLLVGRITTVVWGVVLTGFALLFCVAKPADTVIEGINKIGSLFYGPILATFLAGLLWKKTAALDVICGLISGIVGNFCLWIFCGETVHWMWWNVFGLTVAILVTALVSRFTPDPDPRKVEAYTLSKTGLVEETKRWRRTYMLLAIYFLIILAAIVACTLYAGYLRR